jgi:hypothetical protein
MKKNRKYFIDSNIRYTFVKNNAFGFYLPKLRKISALRKILTFNIPQKNSVSLWEIVCEQKHSLCSIISETFPVFSKFITKCLLFYFFDDNVEEKNEKKLFLSIKIKKNIYLCSNSEFFMRNYCLIVNYIYK